MRCSRTWTCSRTSRSGCARRGWARPRCGPGSARRSAWCSSRAASDSRPRQLSGGQQQRVALARALVNRPEVLLLDEPLGALDLKLRTEMQSQLKDLQRSVGVTFCYVTHDQGEAFSMSDRVAVMNLGPARAGGHAGGHLPPAGVGVRGRLRGRRPTGSRGRIESGGSGVYTVAVEGIGTAQRARPRRARERRQGDRRGAAREPAPRRSGARRRRGLAANVVDAAFLGAERTVRLNSPTLGELTPPPAAPARLPRVARRSRSRGRTTTPG